MMDTNLPWTALTRGAKGIPVTSTSFDAEKKVVLKVANAGITYEGTLISETELDGTFSQGGQDFPIKFTKNREKVEGPKRPQLPKNHIHIILKMLYSKTSRQE